jgi:F-type H+-transporting ATPase subunit alpha
MPVGTKMVDAVIPIAKGQRQLILGDRLTGKTVLALDSILSQKGRDVICIYCCVGKSVSSLEKAVSILQQNGALDYTIVMIATDNAPVGEQYIVPFSAASMGEYFASCGKDVLIVFDDLTKHAWAYRELSLLLERPPGREAYPGDIFYVQTQLMERAGKFNHEIGSGSMTFIGIAETLQGDMTGYIPSNLSSMCDGQIVLSTTVFTEGLRPAIDFGLSLSIIGGRVQPPALKELGMKLRADYARYTEVQRLSKLQTVVADDAQAILDKGQVMMTLLQQEQHNPSGVAESIIMLYALREKSVQGLSVTIQRTFRDNICSYIMIHDPTLLEEIEVRLELTPEIVKRVDTVIRTYLEEVQTLELEEGEEHAVNG